jgi:hypothetical protein
MPYVVQLDLTTTSSSDFPTESSHWLLSAVYGRDLLKAKLRAVRPDLTVKRWAEQPELNSLLDDMVDALQLRDWPEPKSAMDRVRYVATILKMMCAVDNGRSVPSWRE